MIPGAETMEAFATRVRAGIEAVVAAVGPDVDGRRDRPRRRDRRGLPPGHGEPPVRVHARRQRVADAARDAARRALAAAVVQRHRAPGIGCVESLRMDEATLDRFADLVVGFGANVQPGQIVSICCEPGKEYMVRAIAASAYGTARSSSTSRGSTRGSSAPASSTRARDLDFVPTGTASACSRSATRRRAHRAVRPGRARTARGPRPRARRPRPASRRSRRPARSSTTGRPTGRSARARRPAWAELVFPDLEPDAALAKLEESCCTSAGSTRTTRSRAWRARADMLVGAAERLTERRFDALHYEGPGTDLTVGLLPGAPGRPRASRPPTASSTCRTCRPRRSSPRPTRRASTARDRHEAARADRRHRRARAARALRGRPRGRCDRRRHGGRDDAHDHRPRRGRRAPRRGRAGRRARAGSARSTPSSTTRCSTRTRPATSRSARASRSWSARRLATASTRPRSTSTS